MPFPIAIIGAIGAVSVVGVVIDLDHSDYSCHSDYSDAAERRKQELRSKITNEQERMKSARRELEETLREAVGQMQDEYEAEGVDMPDIFGGLNADNLDDSLKRVPDEIKKSVDDSLSARIAETQNEIARVNALLEKINAFRLTGGPQ
jgi:DNA anti-recombination protein RmuC